MAKAQGPESPQLNRSEDFLRRGLETLEDHALVARTLAGDEDAFEVLMNRYTPIVIGYLIGRTDGESDAEDLAQEIFLTAFRCLHRLRATERFGPWLMRIARSRLVDHYRLNHRRPQLIVPDSPENHQGQEYLARVPSRSSSPREQVSQNEVRQIVCREISRLNPRYRAVLTMRLISGMSTCTIARILDLKESTVRMRLFRGLKALRRELRKAGVGREVIEG